MFKNVTGVGADDERWVYKGMAEIVDINVIPVGDEDTSNGGGACFEVVGPEDSLKCIAGACARTSRTVG